MTTFFLTIYSIWRSFSTKTQIIIILITLALIGFIYFVNKKNNERQEVQKRLDQFIEAKGQQDAQRIESAKSDAVIKEQAVNAYTENVNAIRNSNSNVNRTANDLERILKEGK